MSTLTHTLAGPLAAGVARLGAIAGVSGVAYDHHQSATWTEGVIAKPATFMVLTRKNRPPRPLSECST